MSEVVLQHRQHLGTVIVRITFTKETPPVFKRSDFGNNQNFKTSPSVNKKSSATLFWNKSESKESNGTHKAIGGRRY